ILLRATGRLSAVEIHTSRGEEALNGTNIRLKCTFSTFSPIGPQLTVTWNFRPEDKGSDESVFFYQGQPYPLLTGRFKDRVTWDGNIHKNDASIVIWNLKPTDNGTFTCQVKNPPDVSGTIGEIRLSVVQSEIHYLAVAIGSACALMIILVIVVVLCRYYRRKRQEKSTEMVETEL
uniref:Myelin protein zero like 2 n=1 Tax=Crocodylus porosus TaxID=8502 RepID=A0A7M4DV79_CROPO